MKNLLAIAFVTVSLSALAADSKKETTTKTETTAPAGDKTVKSETKTETKSDSQKPETAPEKKAESTK